MAYSRGYIFTLRVCNALNNSPKPKKSTCHKTYIRHIFRLSFCPGSRSLCDINQACWKCGSRTFVSDIICPKCNVLQKPNKKSNYFQILGLNPSYELSIPDLAKRYRRLQSILHPDKYANSNKEEQAISEEYSSLINKAYNTLQQPLTRGLYLLELEGIYLEEGTLQSDTQFLMDVMERNEEVDKANSEDEIKMVASKNKKILDKLINELSTAFSYKQFEKAKNILIKIKYFSSIEEKIKTLKGKKGYVD